MAKGAVVSEWQTVTVYGDIADVIGGGTPSTKVPANFGGDIPWLTPKDLSGNHDRYMSHGARNSYEERPGIFVSLSSCRPVLCC